MALGELTKGVATTAKLSAVNADAEQKKEEAEAKAEADKLEATEDQDLYSTIGEPVFNCFTEKGKSISFSGGKFLVNKNDPNYDDITACLEYHCSTGSIRKL